MWIQWIRIRIRIRTEAKIHQVSQKLFGNLFDDNEVFLLEISMLFFNDYFNYNSNFCGQPAWEILVFFAQIYAKFTKQNFLIFGEQRNMITHFSCVPTLPPASYFSFALSNQSGLVCLPHRHWTL
jgi:hypothetical protein